jgi:hypothetical protein
MSSFHDEKSFRKASISNCGPRGSLHRPHGEQLSARQSSRRGQTSLLFNI